MNSISRRNFLKLSALGGACVALGASPFGSARAASRMSEASWANLVPGFTTLVTDFIEAKRLDVKHNLKLAKPITYTSVPTYYGDFVAGSYDVCIGSWDSFATRYLTGVPIQLVCTITTADMINILAPAGKTIKNLVGRVIAAPQSTGTYRLTRALIQELYDMDIEKAMTVQNVANPAASVTLLMAGRAEAGLSWEPNISSGLLQGSNLDITFNAGQEYKSRAGLDLPYFGVAVRKAAIERDPAIVGRLNETFKECLVGIMSAPEEAIKIAGERTGTPPEVMRLALSSGRLAFKHGPMNDANARRAVEQAAVFLAKHQLLPRPVDDGFFAL